MVPEALAVPWCSDFWKCYLICLISRLRRHDTHTAQATTLCTHETIPSISLYLISREQSDAAVFVAPIRFAEPRDVRARDFSWYRRTPSLPLHTHPSSPPSSACLVQKPVFIAPHSRQSMSRGGKNIAPEVNRYVPRLSAWCALPQGYLRPTHDLR